MISRHLAIQKQDTQIRPWKGECVINVCLHTELKEEVVYYDTCEDPEELHSIMQTSSAHEPSHAVRSLRRRLQQLEMKRGAICARRAYLRNKKVCIIFFSLSFFTCTSQKNTLSTISCGTDNFPPEDPPKLPCAVFIF